MTGFVLTALPDAWCTFWNPWKTKAVIHGVWTFHDISHARWDLQYTHYWNIFADSAFWGWWAPLKQQCFCWGWYCESSNCWKLNSYQFFRSRSRSHFQVPAGNRFDFQPGMCGEIFQANLSKLRRFLCGCIGNGFYSYDLLSQRVGNVVHGNLYGAMAWKLSKTQPQKSKSSASLWYFFLESYHLGVEYTSFSAASSSNLALLETYKVETLVL